MTPRAILFDLDDTILDVSRDPRAAWLHVTREFERELRPLNSLELTEALVQTARAFWSASEPHRLKGMTAARRELVATTFASLEKAGRPIPSPDVARRLADRFTAYRDDRMRLFPDALEVIETFKSQGARLALVTNGHSRDQRAKIERFGLATRFDHIQIEGELGIGKPDERAYRHALRALGVKAGDAWMVGDNLYWEVAAPQALGMRAIWFDPDGDGLPPDAGVKPDHVITSLSELLALAA